MDVLHQLYWLFGLAAFFLALALLSLKYRIASHTYILPKIKKIRDDIESIHVSHKLKAKPTTEQGDEK